MKALIAFVVVFCVFGIIGTMVRPTLLKEPVASTYEPKFGDYVVIKKGLYRGFEGWIDGKHITSGEINIRLNDRSLPGLFIKKNLYLKNNMWVKDQFSMAVASDDIEPKPEPEKPKGYDELHRQVDQILAVVKDKRGSWANTDPVEIDGVTYQVAVKCEDAK